MSWADVVAFAEVHQRGAIAAACPTCGAAPQRGCTLGSGLITPDGTMHRDRVEAHAGRPWPTLDEAPRSTRDDDLRRLAAVYDAMPGGVMALVRVLEFGARHGGTLGPSPDRGNPLAHLRAAHRHVLHTVSAVDYATPEAAVWPIDAGQGGTGELHLANAAGRLVIACELVGRGK